MKDTKHLRPPPILQLVFLFRCAAAAGSGQLLMAAGLKDAGGADAAHLVLQLAPKCFYFKSSLRSHAGMGSC